MAQDPQEHTVSYSQKTRLICELMNNAAFQWAVVLGNLNFKKAGLLVMSGRPAIPFRRAELSIYAL